MRHFDPIILLKFDFCQRFLIFKINKHLAKCTSLRRQIFAGKGGESPRVQRQVCHREKRQWLGFTLYIRARVSRAQLLGPHLVLFSFRRFSRREMKIKETSTSPWSTRSWSTAALRFIGYPLRTPPPSVTQRRTTPRYRCYRNGLRFRVCGASMLITIVCSTIRLKCTFINRIHRGYLSARQRVGGGEDYFALKTSRPSTWKAQWRVLCKFTFRHSLIFLLFPRKRKKR